MVTFIIKDIESNKEIRRRKVRNLDKNLMATAEKMVSGHCAVLDECYNNCPVEAEDGLRFPFILKNGKYEWHVLVKEVSIRDFMLTHSIEDEGTIVIYEVDAGGGDFDDLILDIVLWTPIIWNILSNTVTLLEIKNKALPLYHSLIGKDHKSISPNEIINLLKSKDEWTLNEIRNTVGLTEELLIKSLLMQTGFIQREDGSYKSSGKVALYDPWNDETIDKIKKECWGDYCEELYGYETDEYAFDSEHIKKLVHSLNYALTNLYLQSEYCNSESFETEIQVINTFIDDHCSILSKGKDMQFVKLSEDDYEIYEDNKNYLEHDLKMLIRGVEAVCAYLGERIIIQRIES